MKLVRGQVVFDTTKLYEGIPTDVLHKARLKYSNAVVLFLRGKYKEQEVIRLLDLVISSVPNFLDAHCLREEAWHKYLRRYKGTQSERATYAEYRGSNAWHTKQKQVLERDEHKCVMCSADSALDVHHRTYDNIGKEPLSDLVSLCRRCHHKFHHK